MHQPQIEKFWTSPRLLLRRLPYPSSQILLRAWVVGTFWVRLGVTLITVFARFRLMGNYLGVGSIQFTHLCWLFWYFNLGQTSEGRKQLNSNNCEVNLMRILRIPFRLCCSFFVYRLYFHIDDLTTFFNIKKTFGATQYLHFHDCKYEGD